MRKYFKIKLLVLISTTFFLSGCSLSHSTKNEINLKDSNQTAEEKDSQPAANDGIGENGSASEMTIEPSSEAGKPAEVATNASAEAPVSQSSSTSSVSAANTTPSKFKITNRLVSWGFTKSAERKIDTIIIHSSYNAVGSDPYDLDDIINKEYKPNGVSPHYIIARDGKVSRLVSDQNIAYHAGVSEVPDGRTDVNDFSIGIEVVETKSDSPNSAQYSALKSLISYLKGEYDIKYVLGHSDIAPDRKDDPWNFSWSQVGGKEK